MATRRLLWLIVAALLITGGCKKKIGRGAENLHYLVWRGDTARVAMLLALGADVNMKNDRGDTPLHAAVLYDEVDAARLLIDKGADIDAQNSEGETPLHDAARSGSALFVHLLLSSGANPNVLDKSGLTPALLAMSTPGDRDEIVRTLVAAGSNVTLHMGAYLADTDMTRSVLEAGTDVNAEDNQGYTALHWAARMGRTDVARLLLERGANPNAKTRLWRTATPLHEAAASGHVDVAEILIDKGADLDAQDRYGDTPLHTAARLTEKSMLQFLLAKGANVNLEAGDDKHTALSIVLHCALDSYRRRRFPDNEYREMALLLLTHGAQVSESRSGDGPLLAFAVRYGLKDLAQEVLARGEVDLSADAGQAQDDIPLFDAVLLGHRDIAELLLAAGADVNTRDWEGGTLLHEAARQNNQELATWLLTHGADLNAQNSAGSTPLQEAVPVGRREMTEFLVSQGAQLSIADAKGSTPLHDAVRTNQREMAELLVSKGAQLNMGDARGNTPLHYAAREHKEITELLLRSGARVAAEDNDGVTALHDAALRGQRDIVEVLLTYGADPKARDNAGRTAIDNAARRGHKDIVELLRSYKPQGPKPQTQGPASNQGLSQNGALTCHGERSEPSGRRRRGFSSAQPRFFAVLRMTLPSWDKSLSSTFAIFVRATYGKTPEKPGIGRLTGFHRKHSAVQKAVGDIRNPGKHSVFGRTKMAKVELRAFNGMRTRQAPCRCELGAAFGCNPNRDSGPGGREFYAWEPPAPGRASPTRDRPGLLLDPAGGPRRQTPQHGRLGRVRS